MAELQERTDSTSHSRVALVTAASKGLGRACAEVLAEARYRLVVCSSDPSGVPDTVSALRGLGVEVIGQSGDASDPIQLEAIFAAADRALGRLDVLVSNAGGPPDGGMVSALP